MQLDVHVDVSGQGKEVVRANSLGISVGPDMRQVEDLKRELASVSWEGISDCHNWTPFLPVNQLWAVSNG